jgi:hypothetical protein
VGVPEAGGVTVAVRVTVCTLLAVEGLAAVGLESGAEMDSVVVVVEGCTATVRGEDEVDA